MTHTHTVTATSLLIGCLASGPALGQQHMFRAAPTNVALTGEQASQLELARASSAAIGVSVVAALPIATVEKALKEADASKASSKITLTLSDDTVVTASQTSVDTARDFGVWRGAVDESGGQVTLMWWSDGNIAGTVQHRGRFYAIRPMGGSLHAVVELSEDRMPPDHAPPALVASSDRFRQSNGPLALRALTSSLSPSQRLAQERRNRAAAGAGLEKRKANSSPGVVVIDVMVAYTGKAAQHYHDIKRELVELAIEEANQSFRISNLGHVKLRLVHTYETNYVEEGAHFDHIWRLADKGDGQMEEVHGLRNKYRADVVVLIIDDASGCGLATRVNADADEAFAVVHHECAATTHSVAHEIGHIIGARHDLSMDKIMSPFPYGHGYVNGTKWRDIMSYKGSCGGCPRVPVWSSPTVLIGGEPAGTPQQDNARVIAEQAIRVAAFR